MSIGDARHLALEDLSDYLPSIHEKSLIKSTKSESNSREKSSVLLSVHFKRLCAAVINIEQKREKISRLLYRIHFKCLFYFIFKC